jgi:hypothetical protein
MWVVSFIYFLFLAIPFLVLGGICAVYLLMGITQLVIGYKEQSHLKRNTGWLTLIFSLGSLVLLTSLFLWLIPMV